ncbi:MAG TPA: RDD family protein [Myxococcales bacterium]|nr:RDD family protein [Myxococcales bacterium]
MSRCLKCGAPLPALGDCPACRPGQPSRRQVSQLLSQELQLDRRADTLGIDSRPPPPPPPPRRPSSVRPPPSVPRAAPPTPAPSTPDQAPGGVEAIQAVPAALWRRAGATLVDLVLAASVGAAYLWIAALIVGLKPPPSQLTGLDALMVRAHALERVLLPGAILVMVLAGVYGAVFGWLWEGRTIGRRLFGIRLVDKTGQPPTPVRAVLRAVLSLFSFAAFLGGFWLALFDRKGQTLHDKLTSTFVVRPG